VGSWSCMATNSPPNSDRSNRQKSRIQSLRLKIKLHDTLSLEAERQGVSISSLINLVLQDYADYGRIVARSKSILIGPNVLTAFLHLLSDKQVEEVGRELGSKLSGPPFLAALGLKLTFESAKHLMNDILGKYSKWFESSITEDEGRIVVYLSHNLTEKWSLFLKGYCTCLFERTGLKVIKASVTHYSTTIDLLRGEQDES